MTLSEALILSNDPNCSSLRIKIIHSELSIRILILIDYNMVLLEQSCGIEKVIIKSAKSCISTFTSSVNVLVVRYVIYVFKMCVISHFYHYSKTLIDFIFMKFILSIQHTAKKCEIYFITCVIW